MYVMAPDIGGVSFTSSESEKSFYLIFGSYWFLQRFLFKSFKQFVVKSIIYYVKIII